MGFADEVRAWLELAMLDEAGKPKMTNVALCEKAGIVGDTLYRLLKAKGEPEEATINRLAAALGVPAPRVERVLRHDRRPPDPETPLLTLRAATGLLRRLEAQLLTSAETDGEPAAMAKIAARDEERAGAKAAPRPKSKGGAARRRAGGG